VCAALFFLKKSIWLDLEIVTAIIPVMSGGYTLKRGAVYRL
jgi:hypothetical protein